MSTFLGLMVFDEDEESEQFVIVFTSLASTEKYYNKINRASARIADVMKYTTGDTLVNRYSDILAELTSSILSSRHIVGIATKVSKPITKKSYADAWVEYPKNGYMKGWYSVKDYIGVQTSITTDLKNALIVQ